MISDDQKGTAAGLETAQIAVPTRDQIIAHLREVYRTAPDPVRQRIMKHPRSLKYVFIGEFTQQQGAIILGTLAIAFKAAQIDLTAHPNPLETGKGTIVILGTRNPTEAVSAPVIRQFFKLPQESDEAFNQRFLGVMSRTGILGRVVTSPSDGTISMVVHVIDATKFDNNLIWGLAAHISTSSLGIVGESDILAPSIRNRGGISSVGELTKLDFAFIAGLYRSSVYDTMPVDEAIPLIADEFHKWLLTQ